jgi:hypothetical protein
MNTSLLVNIHLTGTKTTNCYCGKVRGTSKEYVIGCGAAPRDADKNAPAFAYYYYQTGGCWTSVSLCPTCAAKVKENPAGDVWDLKRWLESLDGVSNVRPCFISFGKAAGFHAAQYERDGVTRLYVLGELPARYAKNKRVVYTLQTLDSFETRLSRFGSFGPICQISGFITGEAFATLPDEKKTFHPFGANFGACFLSSAERDEQREQGQITERNTVRGTIKFLTI